MSFSRAVLVPILLACIALCGLQTGCGKKNRDAKKNAAMPKPQAPAAFTISATPNSELALGNEYREQKTQPAEVLVGWKTRCTASPNSVDVSTVTWFVNGQATGISGQTLDRSEQAIGTFTITMKGTKNGNAVSEDRKIIVGQVQSDAFALQAGGNYYKAVAINPHWVKDPSTATPPQAGIQISGKVSVAGGSPALSSFQWGFIQAAEVTFTLRFDYLSHTVTPGTTGTFARVPQYYSLYDIPPNTNDAPKLHFLTKP